MKNSSNGTKWPVGLLMGWIAFAVCGSTTAYAGWHTLTPMPTARHSPQGGVINGLIYVAGGNDGSGSTDVLEVYDPATDTWSTRASMGSSYKVYQGAAGVIDNKLYIAGGWNWPSSYIPTNELKIYDPTTDVWSLGANIPILTGDTVSAVIDRKLYILTAYDGFSGFRKRLFVYDPDTNSWTEKAEPSSIHAVAGGADLDGVFYVVGGYNGSTYGNMVEAYDPVTNTWSTKASMPTARLGLRAEVLDGKLYAVGGHDGVSVLDVVEIYDPATNTWSTGDSMPTPRYVFTSGVINNGLYVVGGYDVVNVTNKLEVYEVVSESPPNADAGDNIQIPSSDQAHTTIQGTATDPERDPLEYRWLDGAKALLDWSPVGANGEAYLNLGTLPCLSFGNHILTLKVREAGEGGLLASDTMILTIASPASIVAWGYNYNGQCNIPSPNSDFIAIAGGQDHSLGLKCNGSIVAWGANVHGQCNIPELNSGFIAISAGYMHSLGLKQDGSIVAWGANWYGQWNIPSPNSGFIAIAAGGYHSLGLKQDGSIVAWGYNWYGQCNIPSPNSGFIAIAAGYEHSLGLKQDGSIVAWGYNVHGQCNIPELNSGFIAISAGGWHSLGLKQDGSIVAWGYNAHGQRNIPEPNSGFIAIAAGLGHSLGLKQNGSIVGWGYNVDGECDIPSPNSDFIAIAAGAYHSLGLRAEELNQPPVANAGPDQTAHIGTLVNLDGSGSSDPEQNYPLAYSWRIISKPQGSEAELFDSTLVNPSFIPDVSGDYTVELVVTDSLGLESMPDLVVISTYNTAPAPEAGEDQAVIEIGSLVQLNGGQSYDVDGDDITYFWTISQKPDGSLAELSDPYAIAPNFVVDVHGDYIVTLVVTDILGAASQPDSVTVSFSNVKPVAVPGGNQAVVEGDTVCLDGSGSYDGNGDELIYNWSIVSKPSGSNAELSNSNTVNPCFVADKPGSYVISLIVNDGFVDSDAANVSVMAISNEDAASMELISAMDTINEFAPASFKNSNMGNALTNKINAALELIDQGYYIDAIDKLLNDILQKTNGCAESGAPDKNDWIVTCSEQGQVYPLILEVIQHLEEAIQ